MSKQMFYIKEGGNRLAITSGPGWYRYSNPMPFDLTVDVTGVVIAVIPPGGTFETKAQGSVEIPPSNSHDVAGSYERIGDA